jgi:hypothetical protein
VASRIGRFGILGTWKRTESSINRTDNAVNDTVARSSPACAMMSRRSRGDHFSDPNEHVFRSLSRFSCIVESRHPAIVGVTNFNGIRVQDNAPRSDCIGHWDRSKPTRFLQESKKIVSSQGSCTKGQEKSFDRLLCRLLEMGTNNIAGDATRSQVVVCGEKIVLRLSHPQTGPVNRHGPLSPARERTRQRNPVL